MTIYSAAAVADNPLVQTNYTADPAPLLYEGRLYLYTSHDEDVTVNNFFTMNDWRLYSTVDMVNWTDHGSPASYKTFSWGTGDAWAIQVVARNGSSICTRRSTIRPARKSAWPSRRAQRARSPTRSAKR